MRNKWDTQTPASRLALVCRSLEARKSQVLGAAKRTDTCDSRESVAVSGSGLRRFTTTCHIPTKTKGSEKSRLVQIKPVKSAICPRPI